MKLSALYKICKKNKIVHILHDEEEERQWIMVEGNLYPTDGLPRMGKEELLTMMDVPKDEEDKWIVKVEQMNERMRYFAADNAQGDAHAEELRARVIIDGEELAAIQTDCGVVLIPAEALKPVSDSAKTYELFSRKVMGEVWIAVKNGFQLIACDWWQTESLRTTTPRKPLMKRETACSSTYKEETRAVPKCCLNCGHYMPQFYRIIGRKECAMFTTVDGVKGDACGAWEPRGGAVENLPSGSSPPNA